MEQSQMHQTTSLLNQTIKNMMENQEMLQNKNVAPLPKLIREMPDAPPPSPASDIIVVNNDSSFFNDELTSTDAGGDPKPELGIEELHDEALAAVEVHDNVDAESTATDNAQLDNPSTDTLFSNMPAFAEMRNMASCNSLFYPFENVVWPGSRIGQFNAGRPDIVDPNDLNWNKILPRVFAILGFLISSFIISLLYIFPKEKGK